MLRVGVVGVGNMGYHHARIYSEMAKEGKVEFVGVVDIDFNRAKKVAENFRTKAFRDYKELIKQNLDGVSVAVPTTLHKKVGIDFMENGINVLVEKPIADSVESAKEMIDVSEKNNVILTVGHVERFNPAVLKLKDIITRGFLGEIVTMNAKRVGPMVERIMDVGVIIDLAVHDIDVMHFLLNSKVKEVYAKARNVKHPARVEDYALILLNFENNVDGIIETNRLTPHKIRNLNVVGSEGVAELDYINQSLKMFNHEWIKEAKIKKNEPLRVELEHFLRCIENNEKPLVSGEDALHALEVAIKAIESAKKDEVIRMR